MAEAHPVGFRWALKARERGAPLIHVDPHFSRTSAMADLYVAIRAGSDIAFLGGIINYIIAHDRWFKDYVLHYTNASTIVSEEYAGAEQLDGLFAGFDSSSGRYEAAPRRVGLQRRGVRAGRDRPDARTSAMRLPDRETSLRALHARDGRVGMRMHPRRIPPRRGAAIAQLGSRTHRRDRLRAWMDAAFDRRADDPRGGDHSTAARQHGPAGRRNHGDARPLQYPGLDRYPDALRSAPRLHPATARRPGPRQLDELSRTRTRL